MSLADELRDPWTYVVGGLSGGMAFAVLNEPIQAVAIGAVVFATKVFTSVFSRKGGAQQKRRPMERYRRLPVMTRTPEAAWLGRAKQAHHVFEDIAASAHDGPIADQVRTFGDQVEESFATLERLAGQASAVRVAMGRLDPRRLAWERDRILKHVDRASDPAVVDERQRALDAVQAQLDAYHRLTGTLTMLLARLETGTLGIEGLVARLAEVVALAATSSVASGGMTQLDDLAHELEGLRAGLVEAESVTTRAMQGLAPLPAPAPGSVPVTEQPPQQQQTPLRRRAGGG